MSECLLCYDHTEDIISCGHNCHYDCLASVMIKSSNKTIENKCCFCFKDFSEETLIGVVKNCSNIKDLLKICIKKDNVVLLGLFQQHYPQEFLTIQLYSIKTDYEFFKLVEKYKLPEENIIIYSLIVSDNLADCFHCKANLFRSLIIYSLDIRTEEHLVTLIQYIKENFTCRRYGDYIVEMFMCLTNKCLSDEMLDNLVNMDIRSETINKTLLKYNNISDDLIKIIIKNNNYTMFDILIKYGYEITEEMIYVAITNNSEEILHTILNENLWDFTKEQIILTVQYGLANIFWKLYKKNMIVCLDDEIILIAEKNIWRTLYDCGYIPDKNIMTQIYKQNQVEKFDYYLSIINKNIAMEIKLELGL